MSGPVISLDEARTRFAHRIEARAARDRSWREATAKRIVEAEDVTLETVAAEQRARWLAELASWPEPFQRAARDVVLHLTEPERVLTHDGVEKIEERRNQRCADDGRRWVWLNYSSMLRQELDDLRAAITTLRSAQGQKSRAWIPRRRQELAAARGSLLITLWLFGHKKILRSELEPEARAWRAAAPEQLRENAKIRAQWAHEIRTRLKGGVYDYGPKKGQRLVRKFRSQLEAEHRQRDAAAAAFLDQARAVETEPDPLVAWGLYSRVHRRAEAPA